MSEKLICPSLMVANFDVLKQEVMDLEVAGADIFHIDIMDGSFVPNFAMGLKDIETVRRATDKLVDVHLMIMNPGNYIDLFADMGMDIIYVHPEAELHPARTLNKIKERGIKVGMAINPETSVATVEPLLGLVDYLMVMTVSPGFAGQKYLDYVDTKIDKLLEIKANYHYEIMVDGAISPERIQTLSSKGVKGFVLGTSSLFGKDKTYKELISEFKTY